jgi:diguanylate cyclase (GGDEF)-like protein/PAS domain S-box-containing protein
MEKEMRENQYRFIFENSLDAILLTSPDGRIYRANKATCNMLQRTEEEICARGRSGVVDVNDPRVAIALAEREKEGKIRAELNIVRKNGKIFPADVTSVIFKGNEGNRWASVTMRDISEMKFTQEFLRKSREDADYFASIDYLTGILNRRTFIQRLNSEINRAEREKTILSVFMVDIDYFKSINDGKGYQFGDAVLKSFAESLMKKMRPYDFCGRYGSDEFIICFPSTQYEQALIIAERLRASAEKEKYGPKNELVHMTVSIGIGCYDYLSGENINALISRVDQNMYIAKKRRNYVYGL